MERFFFQSIEYSSPSLTENLICRPTMTLRGRWWFPNCDRQGRFLTLSSMVKKGSDEGQDTEEQDDDCKGGRFHI